MLNEGFDLRDSGCSNGEENLRLPRHRWYVMKESFSPRILRRATELHDCAQGTVLDPFSGSGTIPLAARELGLNGIGVEVNPFLAFVGRTKTINASRSSGVSLLPSVLRGI